MPGRPMTEEQKRKKRERERERPVHQCTSKSLKLVEEVAPQVLLLDTKPFVISTDELFQVDAFF